jgi:hypothetical protein
LNDIDVNKLVNNKTNKITNNYNTNNNNTNNKFEIEWTETSQYKLFSVLTHKSCNVETEDIEEVFLSISYFTNI